MLKDNYDTIPEALFQTLAAVFPFGKQLMGKFFLNINKNEFIKVQEFLVIVELETDNKKHKIVSLLKNYAYMYKKSWIIVVISKETKNEYFSTCKKSNSMLQMLLQIDNLSTIFNFEKNIFYNASLKIDMESETITLLSENKPLLSIQEKKDIQLLNNIQKEVIEKIEICKTEALLVVKEYDEQAHYSRFDILQMFSQGFIFKIQKMRNGWKIFFYKKFQTDFVFTTNNLHDIQKDLKELADKHAREERFVALFRDN